MDVWLGALVDETRENKRFARICQKKTMFRLKGDKNDEWRVINKTFSPQVRKWLVAKYGDKIEWIYNERTKV